MVGSLFMSELGDEVYSAMFASLNHPARRKILRMLSDKPSNFSTMLEALGFSSSHLTYHLETLGELVTKMNDGRYKLSTFGEAAVLTMRGVEEIPEPKPEHILSLSLKWKSFFAVLMIGVVVLAGISYVQYTKLNSLSLDYQQISDDYELLEIEFERVSADNERLLSWGMSPVKVLTFLQDVIHLDMTKYSATVSSNTVEYRSDLGGIIEEIFIYTLTYEGSKVDVTLRFRNNTLSRYYLYVLEGTPFYSQLQPNNIIDATKELLGRYHEYSGASYLDVMKNMLETADEADDFVTISGNMKLIMSTEGNKVKMQWLYTSNNIDFQAKSLVLSFDNYGFLEILSDDWSLFQVGSTEVNVSKEDAISIARDFAKNYSWTANGVEVNNFNIVEEPVLAELWPHTREKPLILIPYWYVTLYLDRVYPDRVDRLAVGLWADTGEVSSCQTLSW
jgi:DNA-binding transcriptional ArsR family regulator